ncbi:hypothetical protein ABBQ38_015429 [Trebouxia sp. C0009 RCD-2024]
MFCCSSWSLVQRQTVIYKMVTSLEPTYLRLRLRVSISTSYAGWQHSYRMHLCMLVSLPENYALVAITQKNSALVPSHTQTLKAAYSSDHDSYGVPNLMLKHLTLSPYKAFAPVPYACREAQQSCLMCPSGKVSGAASSIPYDALGHLATLILYDNRRLLHHIVMHSSSG